MDLHRCLLTENDCYRAARPLRPQGIMVHSTGAANPELRRYVQPDDGLLGKNPNGNDWNRPRPDGRAVCVHAFIGRNRYGYVATYQTLPWTVCGWHAGGAANQTHIGFEICEDDLTDPAYFQAVYREAAELTAALCRRFGLDPLRQVICHSEGAAQGIASAHSDVTHWFPRHGKTMDDFRQEVKRIMTAKDNTPDGYAVAAVDWARRNGVMNGDERGDLKLHATLTRQDFLVMLLRFQQLAGR